MNNRHRQIVKARRMAARTRYPLTALMTGIDWNALAEAMRKACNAIIVWMERVNDVLADINEWTGR